MILLKPKQQLRILDFDIEARPLSWYGGDLVSREVTAIAAQFVGEDEIYCWLLGKHKLTTILSKFVELYDQADMVTGHYIRGYDLPTVNGALLEQEMPTLRPKLSHDTKLDLIKWQGGSKSQENISAMLGLEHPKISMSQADWREANRLTKDGIERTRKRVVGDIMQHQEMRGRMMELGMLKPPRVWSAESGGVASAYTP